MLLYNVLLFFILILLSPVWLVLAVLNFYNFRDRLALRDPDAIDSRKSILIHGASLGEVGIIRKILPDLIRKYPRHPIIVSATTPAGKSNILTSMSDLISHAITLPLEFRFSVRRTLKMANPAMVVITETELWPNFICEAKRFGARVVLISGRISDRSYPKYLANKWFFRRTLLAFDAIGVQNREYYNRFLKIGASPSALFITGNIKSSLKPAPEDAAAEKSLRESLRLPPGKQLFIAASTRPGEEAIILSAYSRLKKDFPRLHLLLAPRHLNRMPEVEAAFREAGIPYIRKSAMLPGLSGEEAIILDTHGELAQLFRIAEVAFVGGTLTDFGGHNLLEPLPFRVPVCFGPFHDTQKESARMILSSGCGVLVKDGDELWAFLKRFLSEEAFRDNLKSNVRRVLESADACIQANLALI